MSISKVDVKDYVKIVPLFYLFFLTRWYLKMRFVSYTFWTKIPKRSHCVLGEKGNYLGVSAHYIETYPKNIVCVLIVLSPTETIFVV